MRAFLKALEGLSAYIGRLSDRYFDYEKSILGL